MPAKCKIRERIAASNGGSVPALPVGAVRGYRCFRCFETSDKILISSACKRAYYRSKECKRLDWSLKHKKHCGAFSLIDLHDTDLHFIIQAQAYCASCRRTAVQLADRKTALIPCDKCRLVYSCADCSSSPEHSPAICAAYQDHAQFEDFQIGFFEDNGTVSPAACTEFPRETRKLLADAAGWYDYWVNISNAPGVAGVVKPDFTDLEEQVLRLASEDERVEAEGMRMFFACASNTATMSLTILSALEDISWEAPQLRLHIVGATGRELTALASFEEILHLTPSLRGLHITAVGPGLPSVLDNGRNGHHYMPKSDLECCPACTADGRTRSVSMYQGLYHEFAKTGDYEKPDLVVLFNSGWVDGDDALSDWEPTIQGLVEDNVPALFTTYNAGEAQNEQMRMRALGAKFLVEVAEDKWKGLVPEPEFIDEEYGMWHYNAYRYVIQGKK
ncbi:Uu.00g135060.m01.CDS01 [Anthostomella pinea]|uniref:Uu.00g135060.m01.CDS01 n=1 Tax=Anthostomella pinea TaxID=933095 RepID=A0AAI8VP50_9PEZI|nr:Uu.00g135060.m01.CDS01 [Anthostomella pinea]